MDKIDTIDNLEIFEIANLDLNDLVQLKELGYVGAGVISLGQAEEVTLDQVLVLIQHHGQDTIDFDGCLYHPKHYRPGKAPDGSMIDCIDHGDWYCLTQEARDWRRGTDELITSVKS